MHDDGGTTSSLRKHFVLRIMSSSGMLRRVALLGTDVSEERIACIITVTIIGELGTMLPVTSNRKLFLRSVLRLLVVSSALSF
jgi:hypothetical protein